MTVPRSAFVIVPLFPGDEYAQDRYNALASWMFSNSEDIARRFSIDHFQFVPLNPGASFELKVGATLSYSNKTGPAKAVPKGTAVRLALIAILDLLDGSDDGVARRENTFIVQIDGSGAFEFENIRRVLTKLIVEGERIALGTRTGQAWFMGSPERKSVELFENYLLEYWYRINRTGPVSPALVDAQAGCWGINAGSLGHFPLTASSYELEFDVVSSALMHHISFVFTEDLTEGTRIGKSGHADLTGAINHRTAVRKMPFIAHKLGLTKQKIGELLLEYETRFKNEPQRILPTNYVEQLKDTFLK